MHAEVSRHRRLVDLGAEAVVVGDLTHQAGLLGQRHQPALQRRHLKGGKQIRNTFTGHSLSCKAVRSALEKPPEKNLLLVAIVALRVNRSEIPAHGC